MERQSRDFITEPKEMRFYRLALKAIARDIKKIEGPTEEAQGGLDFGTNRSTGWSSLPGPRLAP